MSNTRPIRTRTIYVGDDGSIVFDPKAVTPHNDGGYRRLHLAILSTETDEDLVQCIRESLPLSDERFSPGRFVLTV